MKKFLQKTVLLLLSVCVLAFAGACSGEQKPPEKEKNPPAGGSESVGPSIGDFAGSENELPLVPFD